MNILIENDPRTVPLAKFLARHLRSSGLEDGGELEQMQATTEKLADTLARLLDVLTSFNVLSLEVVKGIADLDDWPKFKEAK